MTRAAPLAFPQARPMLEDAIVDPLRPQIDGLHLVMVGSFNPAIVQPAWLARHRLVTDKEADQAEIEIIRPEISAYRIGPFRIVAQLERFQVETAEPDQGFRLSDVVGRAFGILKETPVRQIGINRTMHFSVTSDEQWHKVGHRLVPKEIWRNLFDNPGTLAVSVQGQRVNTLSTNVSVRVEPSLQIKPGVFVQTNEHFDSDGSSGGWVEMILNKCWEESQAYALNTAQKLLAQCLDS